MHLIFELSRSGLTIQFLRSDRNTNRGTKVWHNTGDQLVICKPTNGPGVPVMIDTTGQNSRAYTQLEREVPFRKRNNLRKGIARFRKLYDREYNINLNELPGSHYSELPHNTPREDPRNFLPVNEGPQELSIQTQFNEIGRTTPSRNGTTRISPTITQHQIYEVSENTANHSVSVIEPSRLSVSENQIPNEGDGVCSANINTFWPSTPSQFSSSQSQTPSFDPNIPHDLGHSGVTREDHGFVSYEADDRRSHAIYGDSESTPIFSQHHDLQSAREYAIEFPQPSTQLYTLTGTQSIHPDPPFSHLTLCNPNRASNPNISSTPPIIEDLLLPKATSSRSNTLTPPPIRDPMLETSLNVLPCDQCGQTFTGRYRKGNLKRHTKNFHSEIEIPTTDKTHRFSRQGLRRSDARKKHEWRKHRVLPARPTAH